MVEILRNQPAMQYLPKGWKCIMSSNAVANTGFKGLREETRITAGIKKNVIFPDWPMYLGHEPKSQSLQVPKRKTNAKSLSPKP